MKRGRGPKTVRYLVARYAPGVGEEPAGALLATYGLWKERRDAEAKAWQVRREHPGDVVGVEPRGAR